MIENRKMAERVSGFLALVLQVQGCVNTLKAHSINFLGFFYILKKSMFIVHAEVKISVPILPCAISRNTWLWFTFQFLLQSSHILFVTNLTMENAKLKIGLHTHLDFTLSFKSLSTCTTKTRTF